MVQALALLLAFQMPVFHLVWIEDGLVVESVEDYTLQECSKLKLRYKARAQAQCVLYVGDREYS